MDILRLIYAVIFWITIMFSCSKDDDITNFNESNYDYNEVELELIEKVNEQRASIGLDKCYIDDFLSVVAEEHNLYMIEQGKPSHDNFDIREIVITKEFNGVDVGENVSYGYRTPTVIVEKWIESIGHKEVMEYKGFTLMGLAATKDKNGVLYVTNIFIGK